MSMLWNDVKNWLTDATKTAIKEAEDLSRRGKLKIEMFTLNRKLEKAFAELGGVVYHVLIARRPGRLKQSGKAGQELSGRPEVRLLVQRIRKLESRLRATGRQWKRKRA